MIKIGFDAKRVFYNFTGLGNYCRTMILDLSDSFPDNEYHLFSPGVGNRVESRPFFDNSRFHVHSAGRKLFKSIWRSFGMKRVLRKENIELYHGLSNELPIGMRATGIKSVVTIHDLIFSRYPKQYDPLSVFAYSKKFKYACEESDRIIAISQSTKDDIIETYGVKESKIDVIYQSCNHIFDRRVGAIDRKRVAGRYGLPDSYLLYVGSIIERKRLLSIVRAVELIPEKERIPLVVIGKGGRYKRRIIDYIKSRQLTPWVVFVTDCRTQDLPAIYQQAEVFIYPSVYEGFGIPVIEALRSQVPVITSDRSSLPEAGGPDSFQVNPDVPEEIAEAVRHILSNTDLRRKMISNGLEYSRKFMSSGIAQQVMDVYYRTLSSD